jgi:16S RNA G1207 methylase RsmC
MITHLLSDNVQFEPEDRVLILNSALDSVVTRALRSVHAGTLVLAEDNVTSLASVARLASAHDFQYVHVPFHDYLTAQPAATIDKALLNLLYQPGKLWMLYALSVAAHALKIGGTLYATGAKDRGVMTLAKRMQELFGNVETLEISKGHRVLRSIKRSAIAPTEWPATSLSVFAAGKLDDGTRMLLTALAQLPLRPDEQALDLGCGAGFIGLALARRLPLGHVTMLDASLAAVAASREAVARGMVIGEERTELADGAEGGVQNVTVLPSDAAQAVIQQRFDLVATNPPFHQGSVQTREIAERFMRESAQILLPQGRLLLVANRFLPYEATLHTYFQTVSDLCGDPRYKVLCATDPL